MSFTLYLPFPLFIFPSSEEQSRLAARKYARVVQKLGFPAKFLDFKIQNMVGSCDVCFPIRLEGLVLTHQQFSRSEQASIINKFGGYRSTILYDLSTSSLTALNHFTPPAMSRSCFPV